MHDRRSAAKVRDLAWIRIAGPNAAFDRGIEFFTAQPNCLCNRFEVMKDLSLTKTKAGELCSTSEESLVAFAFDCAGKVGYFSFDRRAMGAPARRSCQLSESLLRSILYLGSFECLHILKSIDYTATDLQVPRPRLKPSPALEGTRTDAPPPGEFDLVEVANGPIGIRITCWLRGSFHRNGE